MAQLIQLMFQQHSTPMFEFVDDKLDRPRFGLSAGFWIDPKQLPSKAHQTDNREVPDVFPMPGLNAVSQRFKEIVERFEPNTHQFYPLHLCRENGHPIDGNYYIFNCVVSADTLLVGHSDVKWSTRGSSGEPFVRTPPSGKWVLSRIAIDGRHLWCGKRIGSRGGVFISDELHKALRDESIVYYEEKYCCEVDIPWIAEDNVKPILDWESTQ